MIKKINIIFLLIISFSFCTSVFANKSKRDDSSVLSKLDSNLLQECLENKDLPECEEILPLLLCQGSPNAQLATDTIEDDSTCSFGTTNQLGIEP